MGVFSFDKNIEKVSDSVAMALDLLPLTHNSDINTCQHILDSGKLIPHECEIFGEKILYFFYGQPVYAKEDWSYPVFFFIKPQDESLNIKSIYPIDTGGLIYDYIKDKNLKGPKITVKDVKKFLECKINETEYHIVSRKLVSFFFGNNENYLSGKLVANEEDLVTLFAEKYMDLNTIESAFIDKNRSKSIEVHNSTELTLDKSNVEYVIFPEEKLKFFKPVSDTMFAKIDTYPTSIRELGISRIIEYAKDKFKDYLIKKNEIV